MNNLFSLHKQASSGKLLPLFRRTVDAISGGKTLVLGFSNRWQHPTGKKDVSKTERLGRLIAKEAGEGSEYMDIFKLKIYPCEANISRQDGNNCGVKKASLKDEEKNPDGILRCWASMNNKDDELWKVVKELMKADTVLFISPVRWGQACATYQKFIERMSWIENRHSTLGEDNILKNKQAGFICIGHNWNGAKVLETQMSVLDFYGFKVNKDLCWNWQWTTDAKDETADGYKKDEKEFNEQFVNLTIKKSET